MRQIRDWIGAHPWVISSFALGVLTGLALRVPIIPWELPESSATLLGSAFGALVAVGGAAWFTIHQSRAPRAEAKRQILLILESLLKQVDVTIKAAVEWDARGTPVEDVARIGDLLMDLDRAKSRAMQLLTDMKAEFRSIGVSGRLLQRQALDAIGDITALGGWPEFDFESKYKLESCRAIAGVMVGRFGDNEPRLRRLREIIGQVRAM